MLISIIGTRPNLIKLAPIARVANDYEIDHLIIHTGQHYDYELSQVFFEQLDIPKPEEYLEVGSGDDAYQIGETVLRVSKSLRKINDKAVVLVYGDTNATLGAALGAKKSNFIVGHIESGIRTNNFRFPEELNRIISEMCADILFAPTKNAYNNIKQTKRAILSGDVMYDTLCWAQPKISKNLLKNFGVNPKQYNLLTLHRRNNVDNSKTLRLIIKTLQQTGETFIFPVHPRTQKTIEKIRIPDSLLIIPPQGYFNFISLLNYSKKAITDSGGVQKEAYVLGIPCVTLLKAPAWPETIKAGWNIQTGLDTEKIMWGIKEFQPSGHRPNIFGDGNASKIIVDSLLSKFPILCK